MRGNLRQRTKGSWTLTIPLPPEPATGRRRQAFETFRGTKKEALARLTELLNQADKGLSIPKGKVLVRDWLTHWLETDIRHARSPKTYERYKGIAERHLVPQIGNLRLAAVSPSDVKSLLASLSNKGMAPAGVGLVRTVLHGALQAAVRQELLARNVVEAAAPPRIVRSEVVPPDISSVAAVLEVAERTGHPLFAALHLISYSGCRRGEILALSWDKVDLKDGSISITRSLGRTEAGLVFGTPKTQKSRRIVDLDSRTVEILRVHQGTQMLQALEAEGAYENQGLVFADALGRPINPMLLTRTFQGLVKKCGLPPVKLHDLRHFHASVLLSQKQSLFHVSRRLGHANIGITADLYGHLTKGEGREQAEAFAKAMRPRPIDAS